MEIKSIEEISDLPEILYKYRVWSNEYHKTILTNRVVFMAPPTSFEDSLDCKLLKRYDLLTEKDMYNKYLEHSKKENPERTRQQHRKFARGWTKRSPMKDKEQTKAQQEQHFLEFDQRFGVLSLTTNLYNLYMWNKYSDEGKGFCVGFNTKIMFNFLGGGGPVQYYDKLPDILPDDVYNVEHYKQVFSKEQKWEFEEEYRTHKFWPKPATVAERQIQIPKEAYKEIIFGWDTPEEHINDIILICKDQEMTVEFFQAELIENKIKINQVVNNG